MSNHDHQKRQAVNGSVARQRREAAAALALLLEQKFDGLDIAVANREGDHTMRIATEIALLQQDNGRFIIMALKHYAGSLKKLPGKVGKLDRPKPAVHQE